MQATIPSEFSRVLRRYDRDPRVQLRFSGYDCTVRSMVVELGGVSAPTLFFPVDKEAAAERATFVGWKDETAAWHAEHGGPPRPSIKPLIHALENMEWNSLRSYATERGIEASGKRDAVINRIIAWHEGRVSEE